MRFFDDTGAVLLNMLRLAACGAAAELALEVINGWSSARRPNKKALFAVDLAWSVFAAAGFFLLLLAYADGALRLLWFACAFAGAFAFRRLLGKPVRRAFSSYFRFTARARRLVCARVLRPALTAAKKIAVFFSKPLIFFTGCIKMATYKIKSGKIRRRIDRRKRRWHREREKAEKERARC